MAGAARRGSPDLKTSLAINATVDPHVANSRAEKTVSAWAAAHTVPRQKSKRLRKTPRAMKPANQKSTLVSSIPKETQG